MFHSDGAVLPYNTKDSLLNPEFLAVADGRIRGSRVTLFSLSRDAVCTSRNAMARHLKKRLGDKKGGGGVSTSRANAAPMQLPCRGKSLYACTATAGEDCKNTEVSDEEKSQIMTILFQIVKNVKSQCLSDGQLG